MVRTLKAHIGRHFYRVLEINDKIWLLFKNVVDFIYFSCFWRRYRPKGSFQSMVRLSHMLGAIFNWVREYFIGIK